MLALAAQNRWLTNSTEIRNAFISAPIRDAQVYVQPPAGLKQKCGGVWLLKKSLYCLTTASRTFAKYLIHKILSFGFTSTMPDECTFSHVDPETKKCLHIMVVVNDMVQVTDSRELLNQFFKHLQESFEITNNLEIAWFLGIAYTHCKETGNIHSTQIALLDRLLYKFEVD